MYGSWVRVPAGSQSETETPRASVGFLFAIAKSWDEKFTPPKPRKFFQENSLKLYEINSEGGESQRDH